MANSYRTFRLSDGALVKAVVEAIRELNPQDGSKLTVQIDDQHPKQVECRTQDALENEEVKQIISLGASVLLQVRANIPAPYNSQLSIKREQFNDNVTISLHQNLSAALAAKVLAVTQKYLKPYERDESFDKLLGDELSEFYRRREQGLLKLEELAQNLIERNEVYRQKLDEETDKTKKLLQEKCDATAEGLQKQYDEKNEKLRLEKEQLEARIKDLDDRSSRHARRQIRQDLKSAIAERNKVFSLTKKTTQKRNVIHVLFGALIVLLGYIVYLAMI